MIRRLFLDIETSPNKGYFWAAGYKINISPDNISEERKIITAAWKWQGSSKIHSADYGKNQDDRKVVETMIDVCNSADQVVGHYADGFDLPWIRGRAMRYGLIFPILDSIDTKAWSSKYFLLNSNKLDYLARFLGIPAGGKIKMEFQDWINAVEKVPGALQKMVRYNRHDISLLEQVFDKLALMCPPKIHAGVLAGKGKWSCPRCESEKVKTSKTKITAAGTTKYQMQCQNKNCGGYYTISERVHADYLKR